MRHRRTRTAINAKPAHAKMMARNLVTSILLYERIRTTRNRAKAVQPLVDRLIATAKRSEPRLAIRAINTVVTDKNACRKLLEVFVPRFADRPSGFTRITPIGSRKGDGAEMVEFALIGAPDVLASGDAPVAARPSRLAAKKKTATPAA